jgi:hypothetical protein
MAIVTIQFTITKNGVALARNLSNLTKSYKSLVICPIKSNLYQMTSLPQQADAGVKEQK